MKNVLSKKMILILILILPTFLFSQAKEQIPEPPAPPKFDFDFDFQDFQEMDQKTQNELLQKLNKELQKELKVIQSFDKQKYLDLLRESQFKNMEFPYLVKREKEMHEREKRIFELEVKTESLAAQYEKANKTEKERIKNELKQKVSELFTEKEVCNAVYLNNLFKTTLGIASFFRI